MDGISALSLESFDLYTVDEAFELSSLANNGSDKIVFAAEANGSDESSDAGLVLGRFNSLG